MTNIGLLMIGCVSAVTMIGCAAEPPDADGEQDRAAEDGRVAPKDIGAAFRIVQLMGPTQSTNMCVQPDGDPFSNTDVVLAPCVAHSPAQNWLATNASGVTEIVNSQSGKCLYVNGTTSGAQILQAPCNVSNMPTTPSSNALEDLEPDGRCVDHVGGRASRHQPVPERPERGRHRRRPRSDFVQ